MKFQLLIIPVVLLFSTTVKSQDELTAMRAYHIVTGYRDAADSLWDKDHPTHEELTRSLVLLNQGWEYLNRADIFDLAEGNIYLKFRRYNILWDVAHIYYLLGEKDKAIEAVQQMYEVGGYFNSMANDTTMRDVKTDERFIKIINDAKRRQALWELEALKTPFREDLPMNEKIAGLSLLWSQAKYNFVHFDHVDVDWNKTYLDYINRVTNTRSTLEYYRVLEQFYAALKDGHSNVYFPKELVDKVYSRPPFRTELIEGKVFVTDIFSDSIQKLGITKKLEVVSINGQPVLKYAKEKIEPRQSSSTPQDLEVRTFTYALLSGAKDEPLTIELRDSKGKQWKQTITRTGYKDVKSLLTLDYKEIDGIGYLTLNSFEDGYVKTQFDTLFTRIATTKGLIIDVRKNGGGSSDIGYHILACLTDKPFKISRSKVAQYTSSPGGDAQWKFNAPQEVQPNKKLYYSKPVIVLTSARTFSAAEDFVVAFDFMKRGKLVGEPTGGSTGQPLLFDLPGGGTARICAKDDVYPDGKKFVGIGIAPDIYVTKTIADLYADRDAALEKALRLLQ